jgi:hypothetical protein
MRDRDAAGSPAPSMPASNDLLHLKLCGTLSFGGLSGFPRKFFRELKGVHRMLVRLFAEFVGGQMISLAVRRGRSGVGVGRKIVEFYCSIVGAR